MKVKKLLSGALAAVVAVTSLGLSSLTAIGAEVQNTYTYGAATATLYDDGLLEFKGGRGTDFSKPVDRPWQNDKAAITKMLVDCTYLGKMAGANLSNLTEITVTNTCTGLGDYVFQSNAALEKVTLAETITKIPAGAFSSCTNKNIVIDIKSPTISFGSLPFGNDSLVATRFTGTIIVHSQDAYNAVQKVAKYAKIQVEDVTLTDFTKLNELIKKASDYKAEDYTVDSYAALQSAIEEARKVAANGSADQDTVDAAENALQQAIDKLEEAKKLDLTLLNNIIEAARKYTDANYTVDSFKVLTEAIAAAEKTKENGQASQDDINNAAKAIGDAVAGLVKSGDESKATLKSKIDEANGLAATSNVYTQDSIAALKEAIKTAQNIYDKVVSTSEVLPAEEDLLSAWDALIKAMTIDETGESETGLKKLVTQETWLKMVNAYNRAINITDTEYTPESYEVFTKARDAFIEIYNKGQGGVSEAEALKAIADIEAAIEKLVDKTEFDFSALEEAVKKAKPIVEDPQASETYTSSTLNALKEAYDAGVAILADRESVKYQATIINAAGNITTCIERLVKVDKEALYNELQQAISDAEARDADIYTADTYKTFKDALDAARKITMSSTVEQIETATANLKAAIEGLKVDQDIIPAGGPLGYIYHTWTETPFYSGTTDDAMVGATQIRLTFDCADDTSFNRYFNVNYTVNVGTTKSDTEVRGTATEENLGEKGCTAILNLNSPIEAGKSYNIIGYTYGYNNSKDYVFAITKIEFLDANGKILKTITDMTAAKEQLDAAIAKAGAVDAAAYTAESYAELTKAVDAAKALTDKATVAEITAAKDAIEAAIKALVPIEVPVLGAIEGTIKTPGADAEVTVTVATADGETVAEATAANGEYSISDLEDGEYIVTFAADGYAARSYTAAVAGGSVTLEAEIHLYGDVNGDGEITTADVGMANSHAREVSALEGYDFDVAEVTGDGEVTTADVGVINATAQKI